MLFSLVSIGFCNYLRYSEYSKSNLWFKDPRLYAYQDKLQMLFNGREQRSAPFEPCEQVPNRGIYAGQLSIIDREVKLISPNMLHLSSASRIERNWIPLESEKETERQNPFLCSAFVSSVSLFSFVLCVCLPRP